MCKTISRQRLRVLAPLLVFRMLAMQKRHWKLIEARSWQVIDQKLDTPTTCQNTSCPARGLCKKSSSTPSLSL
ncbi:hypothetical protein MUN82_08905 [Hymenobacter aerilatus]|uniref:Uncharacterized protein n=1 Tax=Hymenobacter aerilatus TaxID=2932251 RepID=A0A8T9SY79_9BACT|nr:hypothetical protein [Hymenobacter aerilatus]UOR07202.1 hypothetical protein MUN82_08905 [Hymenobacter aerilatus]